MGALANSVDSSQRVLKETLMSSILRPENLQRRVNDLLGRHFKEKPAPPSSYNADVTDEFSAFVLKLLVKQKKDRPSNFHEVLIALKKVKQIYKSVTEKSDEEY